MGATRILVALFILRQVFVGSQQISYTSSMFGVLFNHQIQRSEEIAEKMQNTEGMNNDKFNKHKEREEEYFQKEP